MRLYRAGQAADVPGLIAGVNAALRPLVLGTFIAISCFWGATLLRERADQMDVEMANSASELLSYFGTLGQGSGHLK